MKSVMLIEMCSNETCGKVHVGKHVFAMFLIQNCLKQGDALLPLRFNFDLEYATGKA
jgi:hypothetical protein